MCYNIYSKMIHTLQKYTLYIKKEKNIMENKYIDLGYEFWDRGYMFRNSLKDECEAYELWVDLRDAGTVKTVDEFLKWILENKADMIFNYVEEDERYRRENEPKIREYFEKNFVGKEWKDIDPEMWDFYSDWHKDVFGYRPHGIVCGEYINPHA